MKIITSPHNLLALTGSLYFIVSFFFFNQTMDIHLHDTYFIIALTYLLRFLAGSLLLFWLLYKVLYKYLLSGFLSWTHIISTLIATILILTFNNWSEEIYSTKGFVSLNDLKQFQRYNTILSMLTVILAAGQFIFLINLLGGLVKKLNKNS